jgi:thiol:disulfide interchange protein DsbD
MSTTPLAFRNHYVNCYARRLRRRHYPQFYALRFPDNLAKGAGLVRHSHSTTQTRKEGLGFLLGTVVTMLMAAILLALRAGGTAVGWGFQLQSPLVIAFLALIILGAA